MDLEKVQLIFQTIVSWPVFSVVLLILFTLFFLSIIYYLFVIGSRIESSKTWPFVEGQVTNCELTRKRDRSIDDNYVHMDYAIKIEYKYKVAGKGFTSNQIALLGYRSTSDIQKHRDFFNKHPVGSTIKVFYNSKKPGMAILEKDGKARLLIILTGLVLGLGVLGTIIWGGLKDLGIEF